MDTSADVEDGRSEILIDTREVKDEISLIWRIANFSKNHKQHDLKVQFSSTSNSTTWVLQLNKTCIYLGRTDNGETVYCDHEASLVTVNKTYKNQQSHMYDKAHPSLKLLVLDHHYEKNERGDRILIKAPLEFQDDVFKFRCNMKISGPIINQINQSSDYLKPNFEKLINDFRNLLNIKQHCDVILSIGSNKLPVHKAFLCARSKEFDRMFQDDAEGNKNRVIELHDFDFNTVKDFVTFLYTGNIEGLSIEKAKNLYHIAVKYDVTDLREKCAVYLELNLRIDEAFSVLKLAELHKDDKLKNAATFFLSKCMRQL